MQIVNDIDNLHAHFLVSPAPHLTKNSSILAGYFKKIAMVGIGKARP